MDLFQLLLIPVIMLTIAMQVAQFYDFRQWRAQVIDVVYLAIVIALMFYAKIFPWQNELF